MTLRDKLGVTAIILCVAAALWVFLYGFISYFTVRQPINEPLLTVFVGSLALAGIIIVWVSFGDCDCNKASAPLGEQKP